MAETNSNPTIRPERVRVLRLVEYEGPREWVETSLMRALQGRKLVGKTRDGACYITAVTLTQYPEVLEVARQRMPSRDEETTHHDHS